MRDDQHTFINRLRILASLDGDELEPKIGNRWLLLRDDPFFFLITADTQTANIVWRAIIKRET